MQSKFSTFVQFRGLMCQKKRKKEKKKPPPTNYSHAHLSLSVAQYQKAQAVGQWFGTPSLNYNNQYYRF